MTDDGKADYEPLRCAAVKSSGNVCSRHATYQVNGVLTCSRHLGPTIHRHATSNVTNHLWASVQILPPQWNRP